MGKAANRKKQRRAGYAEERSSSKQHAARASLDRFLHRSGALEALLADAIDTDSLTATRQCLGIYEAAGVDKFEIELPLGDRNLDLLHYAFQQLSGDVALWLYIELVGSQSTLSAARIYGELQEAYEALGEATPHFELAERLLEWTFKDCRPLEMTPAERDLFAGRLPERSRALWARVSGGIVSSAEADELRGFVPPPRRAGAAARARL